MNNNLIFRRCLKNCQFHREKFQKYLCSCGTVLCEDCLTNENTHNHKEMELFLLNNEHDVYKELLENYVNSNFEYQKLSNFSFDRISNCIYAGIRFYFGALLRSETERINNLLKKKCALFQQKVSNNEIKCEDVFLLKTESNIFDNKISLELFNFMEKKNSVSVNFKDKINLIFADMFDIFDYHLLNKISSSTNQGQKLFEKNLKAKMKNKINRKFTKKRFSNSKFELKNNQKITKKVEHFDPLITQKINYTRNSDVFEAIQLQTKQIFNVNKEKFSTFFTENEPYPEAFKFNHLKNIDFNQNNCAKVFENTKFKNGKNGKNKSFNIHNEKNSKIIEDESFTTCDNLRRQAYISNLKADNFIFKNFDNYKDNKLLSAINLSAEPKKTNKKNISFETNKNEFEHKIQSEKTKTLLDENYSKSQINDFRYLTEFNAYVQKPKETVLSTNQNKNEFIKKFNMSLFNKHFPLLQSSDDNSFNIAFNIKRKEFNRTEKMHEEENKNEVNYITNNDESSDNLLLSNIYEKGSLTKTANFEEIKKKNYLNFTEKSSKDLAFISKNKPVMQIKLNKQVKETEELNSKSSLDSSYISSLSSSNKDQSIGFSEFNDLNKNFDLTQFSFETNIESFANKINEAEDILKINLNQCNEESKITTETKQTINSKSNNTEKKLNSSNEVAESKINKLKIYLNLKEIKNSENEKQKEKHSNKFLVSKTEENNAYLDHYQSLSVEKENSLLENLSEENSYEHKNIENHFNKINNKNNLEHQKIKFDNNPKLTEADQVFKGNLTKIAQLLERRKSVNVKRKILPYKNFKNKKVKKFHTAVQLLPEANRPSNYVSYYDTVAASKELTDEILSLEHHFKCVYYNKNISLRAAKCICLKQLLGIRHEKKKASNAILNANTPNKVQVRCEDCKKFFTTGEDTVYFRKKCFLCFENSKKTC